MHTINTNCQEIRKISISRSNYSLKAINSEKKYKKPFDLLIVVV